MLSSRSAVFYSALSLWTLIGRAGRPFVAGQRGDSVPPATPGPEDVTTRAIVPDFCVGCNDLDQVCGIFLGKEENAHNPVPARVCHRARLAV